MCLPSAIWPKYWDPLALKIFFPYGYVINKVHNILLYDAGQFYVKTRWRPNKNLWNLFREQQEDLLIDTLLTPVIFCETVPLKRAFEWLHVLYEWLMVDFRNSYKIIALIWVFWCWNIWIIILNLNIAYANNRSHLSEAILNHCLLISNISAKIWKKKFA